MFESGTFDIILPAYKNLEKVQASLKGFQQQTTWNPNNTVYLCINGDPTPFLAYLKDSQDLTIRVVPLYFEDRENHGRAANRNQALKHLTSEYVLYHDSDLVPDSSLLEEHYQFLAQGNCISVGMVEYENKDKNIWAKYQYYSGRAKYQHGMQIPFHYLNTQNVAMKSNWLKEVGGQMEELVHYGGDDTELGYRLGRHYPDLKMKLNTKAVTTGYMDKSLDKALQDVFEFGKFNFPKILQRHPEFGEIYHIERYRSSVFLRMLLHLPIARAVTFFRFVAPVKIVHFLTVKAVYEGLAASGFTQEAISS